jgi:hypothetical protein
MKKINKHNLATHLIEYQLHLIGKTLKDAENDELWFYNFTMTETQFNLFRRYALLLIQKVYKYNKAKTERTFDWFNLGYGLRIKDTN